MSKKIDKNAVNVVVVVAVLVASAPTAFAAVALAAAVAVSFMLHKQIVLRKLNYTLKFEQTKTISSPVSE